MTERADLISSKSLCDCLKFTESAALGVLDLSGALFSKRSFLLVAFYGEKVVFWVTEEEAAILFGVSRWKMSAWLWITFGLRIDFCVKGARLL